MEDVLEVYRRPYDPLHALVCLDELSKQLLTTPRGELPLQAGQVRCEDYEYARHGTCNLFMAVEPLRGFRRVWVTARRTKLDFAEILRLLVDEVYPHAQRIVLVTDNLNTHSPVSLYERFAPAEARRIAAKLEWHYTPEHGSWLNIAECELSVLHRQCLNRRLSDQQAVEQEAAAWQSKRNHLAVTVDWQFTTTDARIKLKHLYPIINAQ
jgi:hypothetical protein